MAGTIQSSCYSHFPKTCLKCAQPNLPNLLFPYFATKKHIIIVSWVRPSQWTTCSCFGYFAFSKKCNEIFIQLSGLHSLFLLFLSFFFPPGEISKRYQRIQYPACSSHTFRPVASQLFFNFTPHRGGTPCASWPPTCHPAEMLNKDWPGVYHHWSFPWIQHWPCRI